MIYTVPGEIYVKRFRIDSIEKPHEAEAPWGAVFN
jgi:hypothetical protein